MGTNNKIKALMLCSVMLCTKVWAVDAQGIGSPAGLLFAPTLSLSEADDDNLRAVGSNRKSSWVARLSPMFILGAQSEIGTYALSYKVGIDRFNLSQKDNHAERYLHILCGA